MSLDLAIINEQGYPSYDLKVSTDSHFLLMQQAEALSLPQISRMHDYYQDVDYTAQETRLLKREAEELAARCSEKPEFCALLDQLQSLLGLAVNDNKAVTAIAD